MADQEDSLENLLNRATNPAVRELDMDHVMAFCEQVNKELEGPQISVRLLAHKIQSPQEREAEYALATLEACVRNCGQYFHQEIGKFRFLNEVIKVISPKYLGNRTSEKIKKKCIEILYSWKLGLPQEAKIAEAYSMLKSQGIVKADPSYIDKQITYAAPAKPRRADFEDEEKAKMLNRLLKSKNPEDLQAANRLIKNMVKEDVIKSEKISKRINELQTIGNNVQLLQEMIQNYSSQSSASVDKEMMKELYESLEKLRPNLFRLASDTDEKDNDGINDILQANDSVMKVMSLYKTKVEGVRDERADVSSLLDLNNDPSKSTPTHTAQNTSSAAMLEDQFEAWGISGSSDDKAANSNSSAMSELNDIFNMAAQPPAVPPTIPQTTVNTSQSLFNTNPTLAMGMFSPLNQPAMMAHQQQNQQQRPAFGAPVQNPSMGLQRFPSPFASMNTSTQLSSQPQKTDQQKPVMPDLDMIGQSLLQQNLGNKELTTTQKGGTSNMTLNQLSNLKTTTSSQSQPQPSLLDLSNPVTSFSGTATTNGLTMGSPSKTVEIQPLTDIFVPLESIKPGEHQPVTVLDKNNLKILIHIGKDRPRPDVSVMVISTLSTSSSPIRNYVFQAAVPKVMKVKLQPPSANTLPAYNPILPPTAITQIMLLANPKKEKVRLKFKLTYSSDDQTQTEMGEVDTLPIQ
ncbi:ADP-ribosylation factor-binding protein GGA1 isoform X1 [Patella vulgata]|uniref:ADP-ribosylation factor-binding protein GGA1 isoform X1 n=1 Tax=Patella vulgata TaxID=6465 RepID=UPI00217F3EE8|nr:ADP-ribosylation factor-binding protein GGA1 isoform X1 [Patella vulgata]